MTGENPFREAMAVYGREPCARPFTEDLEAHMRHGWVISTPTIFLMARPVRSDWPDSVVLNPWELTEAPDAWHVWLAAGEWREAFSHAPFPLRWVSFQRRNILHRHDWQTILRHSRAIPRAPQGRRADAPTGGTGGPATA